MGAADQIRWIGANVLFHQEMDDYLLEDPARQGCIAFLDFEKAYDRRDILGLHGDAAAGVP